MDGLACNRCGSSRERDDNFCRRCGHQLTVNLPAVRAQSLSLRPRALPPSLVRSMAVLAIGTGLEWVARRAFSSATRAAGRALLRDGKPRSPSRTLAPSDPASESASIDEVLYIRKIQLRR